jgi:hypothetical protein
LSRSLPGIDTVIVPAGKDIVTVVFPDGGAKDADSFSDMMFSFIVGGAPAAKSIPLMLQVSAAPFEQESGVN